ncbi:hypothetical protein ATCVTN60342_834L [Acanthocystis turfacea Chlorella virus TN603.4.2]|nr:hypothetical protein ATCVTN60342_834L [Acanthocystis turfacea Chlorella virus TN603.4.2]
MISSSLFVVTPVSNHKQLAGINHAHAVKHIQGAAVFGFRSPEVALRVAYGIDSRITLNKTPVLCEELIEPFSHLSVGQDVLLKSPVVPEGTKLYNVQVGKVDESQITSYCSALQISAIILDFSSSYDSLYVKEIISPERSTLFSAGYLSHMFDKDIAEYS